MSFSRVDDDGALYIPQNVPANPEPLQTPLTWEPKSLSGKILTARKLLKIFPSSNANTSIRAVNKLSFLEGTIAEPVHKNEFVVITGPKDAGKSTLLKVLGCLIPLDDGELTLHLAKNNLYMMSNASSFVLRKSIQMRVDSMGCVLQPPILLYDLTALQNIEFPMILAGRPRNTRHNEAILLLKAVGLANRIDAPAWQLSKSEQQRVAIAQAFANSPSIVFLDEPTNNLTHAETIHIMDFLLARNRKTPATAIVMVCDNVLLHCYADRVLYMTNGSFQKSEVHHVQRKLDKAKYVAHMTIAEARTRLL